MADKQNHLKMYSRFKNDAENETLFEGTRVEAYFLAAFHLIESCAAKFRIHINKHQMVRSVLEKNRVIFGERTEQVWRSFQKIENHLRPKFVYGMTWSEQDFELMRSAFNEIENECEGIIREG